MYEKYENPPLLNESSEDIFQISSEADDALFAYLCGEVDETTRDIRYTEMLAAMTIIHGELEDHLVEISDDWELTDRQYSFFCDGFVSAYTLLTYQSDVVGKSLRETLDLDEREEVGAPFPELEDPYYRKRLTALEEDNTFFATGIKKYGDKIADAKDDKDMYTVGAVYLYDLLYERIMLADIKQDYEIRAKEGRMNVHGL